MSGGVFTVAGECELLVFVVMMMEQGFFDAFFSVSFFSSLTMFSPWWRLSCSWLSKITTHTTLLSVRWRARICATTMSVTSSWDESPFASSWPSNPDSSPELHDVHQLTFKPHPSAHAHLPLQYLKGAWDYRIDCTVKVGSEWGDGLLIKGCGGVGSRF